VTARTTTRIARAMWISSLVMFGVSFVLVPGDLGSLHLADVTQSAAFLSIGAVGFVLARRRPENAVGWLYLSVWFWVAVVFGFAGEYAKWAATHPGAFGGAFAEWLNNWAWVPIFVTLLTFPFLLFPDGHLPSRRWRPVAWAAGVIAVLWGISFALQGADYTDVRNRHVKNPFAIQGLVPFFDAARIVLSLVAIAIMFLSVASLVVRFRRSATEVRQQIKWLMISGGILAVWLLFPVNHGSGGWPDAVQGLLLTLLPVSVGIAILKYRLNDIDLVINKAVVYGALAAFITVVYVGIVVGIGAAVGDRTSPVLSALAAGVVALAFQPLRRRAQHVANRVVYGKRATPYEVLSGFAERLGDAYSVDDVLPRLARVLAEGIGANEVGVWLRSGRGYRRVGAWPSPTGSDEVDELPGRSFDVRHQGEALGAITVSMPANEPLSPTGEKLAEDIAGQAGLVLRNAALVADLRASRQRLVAAQDEERRKIERNIHDGAQQQLIALAVQQRLAESLIGRDDDRAKALLAELQSSTNQALEDLRDLARGIYPPLLADKGLAVALEAQARKSPVAVTVHADQEVRYPQEIEAAVYFCTLEALQNVAKYANATNVNIRLAGSNGDLTFSVVDDGAGFDPSTRGYGTGLQGIADRLAALGGELEVRSAPGDGTTVAGRLPTGADR